MSLRIDLLLRCDGCLVAELLGQCGESARSLRYRAKGEHGWIRRLASNRRPEDLCDRCRRGFAVRGTA